MIQPEREPGIVVSGLGVLSAVGTGSAAFYNHLSHPSPDQALVAPNNTDKPLSDMLGVKEPRLKISRYMDPASKNAIVAFRHVLSNARIEPEAVDSDPYGYAIVFGATRGPRPTRKSLYEAFERNQRKLASGTLFSHCGYNMTAAMVAMAYGVKGPNLTFCKNAGLGTFLLRRAVGLIRARHAHVVFVGFSESKHGRFAENAVPFAELAFFLCLESEEHAAARNVDNLIALDAFAADAAMADLGKLYGVNSQSNTGQDLPDRTGADVAIDQQLGGFEPFLPLIKIGFVTTTL